MKKPRAARVRGRAFRTVFWKPRERFFWLAAVFPVESRLLQNRSNPECGLQTPNRCPVKAVKGSSCSNIPFEWAPDDPPRPHIVVATNGRRASAPDEQSTKSFSIFESKKVSAATGPLVLPVKAKNHLAASQRRATILHPPFEITPGEGSRSSYYPSNFSSSHPVPRPRPFSARTVKRISNGPLCRPSPTRHARK